MSQDVSHLAMAKVLCVLQLGSFVQLPVLSPCDDHLSTDKYNNTCMIIMPFADDNVDMMSSADLEYTGNAFGDGCDKSLQLYQEHQ